MPITIRFREELKKYLDDKITKEKNTVIIITAYKLSDSEIGEIQSNIQVIKGYKTINIVDKSIIAGIIIKFGTKIIDLSLQGQLKNFKKILYEIN